jgi:hypothetical protein
MEVGQGQNWGSSAKEKKKKKNELYFRNGYMKQLENKKETQYFFAGKFHCNILVASGAPINAKGKWRTKRNVDCGSTRWESGIDTFLSPLNPRILLHAASAYGDVWKSGYTKRTGFVQSV